ncbi:MAG: hypothetical protein H6822_36665 [Planctomycetaceae bacterium]|nr:hypothetical protein [Planctomycetales bacterium]MCB9927722.1 hypothetical protein [Planctomycetaceae bacterium]
MRPLTLRLLGIMAIVVSVAGHATSTSFAQDAANTNENRSATDELQRKAAVIAASYDKLEQLILRMAEIETLTNPQRAALLKRAALQSSERRTKKQLTDSVALLIPPAQLKRAIDEQERGLADMKALLELLLSEDRADRLKAEEQRIRDYIKEVERLIRLQKSAEGRTRGGADAAKLADEQDRIASRTEALAEEIRETEEGGADSKQRQTGGEREPKESDGDGEPSDAKPAETNPGEPKASEPKASEPKATPGQPAESPQDADPNAPDPESAQPQQSPSQNGEPKQSESKNNQSQQNDQNQQPPNEQSNPARKRLEAAEERMREAQQRLEEAKRDDAVEEQEKARHELEKAKAELEEILRQLREEEIGRTLAMLEGRFRRMLEKQLEIFESTKRLDKITPDERGRQVDIQASKLGFDETKLAVEADKALLLLHEEGSSVAFPETVEMMRDDMQKVADRLSATKIGTITQGIEEEIITALEELIAALQQAQQDLEEKKEQNQQQGQPQQPGDEPLVDKIAELKMIRALQMRVNTRTTRYSQLLDNSDDIVGQAEDDELRDSLVQLGERQDRIHEVTKDIVLGKNK